MVLHYSIIFDLKKNFLFPNIIIIVIIIIIKISSLYPDFHILSLSVIIFKFQIDVEDLAKIPIHLIAKLVQFDLNEALLKHLLSGLSLLHTLYDIAPRFPKLEQVGICLILYLYFPN